MTSTPAKLALLATLYLSQGLPFGFFTQALPVLMRQEGYSLAAIGLSSLLAAPWGLKFLIAPWVDRARPGALGRRRKWILALQLANIALLLGVSRITEAQGVDALLALVVFVNLFAATQDVATDGMAVDMLSPSERGPANGVQVAGYRGGMVIGGGALLVAFDAAGWQTTFELMLGILALATLPIALVRPASDLRAPDAHTNGPQPSWAERMLSFARRPDALHIALILFTYRFGDWFGTSMVRPMMADLGFSLADVGRIMGAAGSGAGLVGALLGGWWVGRVSRRSALLLFGICQAATLIGYLALSQFAAPIAYWYAASAVEHAVSGMASVALFTCMMDWSRPGESATDYTVQACLVVSVTALASVLGGFSAQWLGYGAHLALALAAALAGLWVAMRVFARTEAEG